jgi:hypothetical protein
MFDIRSNGWRSKLELIGTRSGAGFGRRTLIIRGALHSARFGKRK